MKMRTNSYLSSTKNAFLFLVCIICISHLSLADESDGGAPFVDISAFKNVLRKLPAADENPIENLQKSEIKRVDTKNRLNLDGAKISSFPDKKIMKTVAKDDTENHQKRGFNRVKEGEVKNKKVDKKDGIRRNKNDRTVDQVRGVKNVNKNVDKRGGIKTGGIIGNRNDHNHNEANDHKRPGKNGHINNGGGTKVKSHPDDKKNIRRENCSDLKAKLDKLRKAFEDAYKNGKWKCTKEGPRGSQGKRGEPGAQGKTGPPGHCESSHKPKESHHSVSKSPKKSHSAHSSSKKPY
jgi:hypothetical protein